MSNNAPDHCHERALRQSLLTAAVALDAKGLNRGSSGNSSLRYQDRVLITPSGVPVSELSMTSLVTMDMAGTILSTGKPSSEWRFHVDIYAARPEIGAIVHTHSPAATALACLRRELPAFHYMIAVAGGDSIRCAPYALFGSTLLSQYAVAALQGRLACLLANHGLIALGRDLIEAVAIAEEIEQLCAQYLQILSVGEPILLNSTEMNEVLARFKSYRQG